MIVPAWGLKQPISNPKSPPSSDSPEPLNVNSLLLEDKHFAAGFGWEKWLMESKNKGIVAGLNASVAFSVISPVLIRFLTRT